MFIGLSTRIGRHLRVGAYWHPRPGRRGRSGDPGRRSMGHVLLGMLVVTAAAAWYWW